MSYQTDVDYDLERNQENIRPLKQNVICPKMKSNGTPNNKKNWNTIQCIERIRSKNSCIKQCPIAKKIKNKAKTMGKII
jgi:hypothetical protein